MQHFFPTLVCWNETRCVPRCETIHSIWEDVTEGDLVIPAQFVSDPGAQQWDGEKWEIYSCITCNGDLFCAEG